MSVCRKCGLPLAFKRNARGKLVPTNTDGSDHFDICRKVQFEKVKAGGVEKTRRKKLGPGRFYVETGYEYQGKFIATTGHYEDSHGRTI